MRFQGIVRSVSLVGVVFVSISCGGGGSNSANSPTSPSNTPVLGVWTGTLTRPGGNPPLSIRWETPTLNDYKFSGPLTLSNGQGVSVQATGEGGTAGNDNQGYKILVWFQSDAVAPNCTVRGNSEGAQSQSSTPQGDPFPAPYTTITVSAFNITYVGCTALLGPTGLNLAETVQLRLVKQ